MRSSHCRGDRTAATRGANFTLSRRVVSTSKLEQPIIEQPIEKSDRPMMTFSYLATSRACLERYLNESVQLICTGLKTR